MDSTIELEKVIINRIKRLPKQQQQEILDFIDFLEFKLEKNAETQIIPKRGREWKEIQGKAPYPLVEQDAQNWVSINRNKDTENRESDVRIDREY